MPDSPDFSEIIRFHRKRAGLSQSALADLAGVGKTVVFDVENGKETVRLSTLVKIMGALNITLGWNSPLRSAFDDATAADPDEHGPEDDR